MRHNFRELDVWKESFAFVKEVYSLTAGLPDDEKYGLIGQIRRSAVSIPSNIAEGSGRTTEKDFVHFLSMALSSSYELETQLLLIEELYKLDVKSNVERLQSIQRRIGGLKRKLINK
ncbi:MAG: four helix bundle protein [Crocinitomicaceae bacterium]|jgi:four helix bundle protein|nr:four helix bundle protein [Crocinitomicaceae bacterium]